MDPQQAAIEAVRAELVRLLQFRRAGQKAVETAHLVRNSASSIALNAELMQNEADVGDEARRLCRSILREAEKLLDHAWRASWPARQSVDPEQLAHVDTLCASLYRPTLLDRLLRRRPVAPDDRAPPRATAAGSTPPPGGKVVLRGPGGPMKRETVNPTTLPPSRGYAQAAIVPAGRQLHISGQVALDAAGQLVGKGDLAAQTEQVYANLGQALAAAGASFADVFKIVTYVVGITPDKVAAIRSVRARHFGDGPFPASTMVGVTGLVDPELLIEVEAIAALD